jgi:hypothetical protein
MKTTAAATAVFAAIVSAATCHAAYTPLAHWDFERTNDGPHFSVEGSNWRLNDVNTADITEGVPGKFGKAVEFGGTNGYLTGNPATNTALAITTGSIFFWVYITDDPTGQEAFVLSAGEYGLFDNNTRQVLVRDWDNNPGTFVGTGYTVPTGQWVQLGMTFQADVANGSQFYVNGQPQGGAFTYNSSAVGGGVLVATGNGSANFFDGVMDELWIYDEILPADKISFLAANNFIPEPGSGLLMVVAAVGAVLRRRRRAC